MKLKLQFWKTNKILAVTVLEQEGLPIKKDNSIIRIDNISAVRLYPDVILIGNCPDTIGNISHIYTKEARRHIDTIVNAITDELFSPGQQELKEGDIVTVDGSITYTLAKIFPENYSYSYVLTTDTNHVCLSYKVFPVTQKSKFTQDITDTTETYTWEM